MPPSKKNPIDRVYTQEIEPLWRQIDAICRANNICAISAFSVPLTQNTGVVMLNMTPSRDKTVPTAFREAYLLIDGRTPQAPKMPEPPKASDE